MIETYRAVKHKNRKNNQLLDILALEHFMTMFNVMIVKTVKYKTESFDTPVYSSADSPTLVLNLSKSAFVSISF